MYDKLVGMIGIVMIEVVEFDEIYGFYVVDILINLLIVWIDEDDEIYWIVEEKYEVILLEIEECNKNK